MKEIGAMLKAAREEKGLSLADLQMATKIRSQQLEALEAGDFHKLPGEVYVRGFLRNYAEHVGLDAEQILARYYARKHQLPSEEADDGGSGAAENAVDAGKAVKREGPAGMARAQKKANLMVMAGVGVVLVVGLVLGTKLMPKPTADSRFAAVEADSVSAPAVVGTEETAAENNDPVAQTTAEEPGWAGEATEEPAQTLPANKGRLVIEASEVVWLGIYRQSSRALIFEGTLYPGERREWILTEDVALRIGNAGGVRLNYEGQDLGELGTSGQVITKVIAVR